jgi:hypothetical protein
LITQVSLLISTMSSAKVIPCRYGIKCRKFLSGCCWFSHSNDVVISKNSIERVPTQQTHKSFAGNPVKANRTWASIVSGCTVPTETSAHESLIPPTPQPVYTPIVASQLIADLQPIVTPVSPTSYSDQNDDINSQITDVSLDYQSLDYQSDMSDDELQDLGQVYSYTPTLEHFPEYKPHNGTSVKQTIKLENLVAPPTQPYLQTVLGVRVVQHVYNQHGQIIGMIV